MQPGAAAREESGTVRAFRSQNGYTSGQMIPDHLPLAEAKNRLSEVVDHVDRNHARVVITKHGRPAVVLINVEDLESLEETLEIMSDPELMADIREAEKEIAEGRFTTWTKEEALEFIRRRR